MVVDERDRIDHRINFRSSLSFVDHSRFQEDPKGNGMLDVQGMTYNVDPCRRIVDCSSEWRV